MLIPVALRLITVWLIELYLAVPYSSLAAVQKGGLFSIVLQLSWLHIRNKGIILPFIPLTERQGIYPGLCHETIPCKFISLSPSSMSFSLSLIILPPSQTHAQSHYHTPLLIDGAVSGVLKGLICVRLSDMFSAGRVKSLVSMVQAGLLWVFFINTEPVNHRYCLHITQVKHLLPRQHQHASLILSLRIFTTKADTWYIVLGFTPAAHTHTYHFQAVVLPLSLQPDVIWRTEDLFL